MSTQYTFKQLSRLIAHLQLDDADERLERAAQNLRETQEIAERAALRGYCTGVVTPAHGAREAA